MNEDLFLLDMPNFHPEYDKRIYYSYINSKGKENLKNLLAKTSRGYCMYCYSKVIIDGKNFGDLEHSIEKSNSDRLKNCIGNISLSCVKCNRSFKRKGEYYRKLNKEDIEYFEDTVNCTDACLSLCEEYKKIKQLYISMNAGKIILQPFGVTNSETGNEYKIQYDILNQKFIPSQKYKYTNEEKIFIHNHINRFNLNDCKFRTKEFSKFCEDVLEYGKIPKLNRYCNLVVDLFLDKVKDMNQDDILKICSLINIHIIMKSKT